MQAIREHEMQLTHYAMHRLSEVPGLRLFGPESPQRRGGVLAFDLDVAHPHDVAQILDQDGIAVRAGHHCAQPLHRRLDVSATTRASLYLYNNESDVDALVAGLMGVRRLFAPKATRVGS
jgi:cysteine desulfurase/selenocysteine lyase